VAYHKQSNGNKILRLLGEIESLEKEMCNIGDIFTEILKMKSMPMTSKNFIME